MTQSGKFILRLTIRLEIYTNLVVVPMTQFFTTVTRQRSSDEQLFATLVALLSTILMITLGTFARTYILSRLLKQIDIKQSDKPEIKKRLLNYPRIEVLIIIFRWFFGLLIPYVAVCLNYRLTISQMCSFFFIVILAISTNAVISFFTTENIISDILKTDIMSRVIISEKNYRNINTPFRLLLTVAAVLIMPMITLGYMLFLVNSGTMQYTNLLSKITIMMFLSTITLAVLMYEATNGIRRSMRMTTNTLKDLSGGEFNTKQLPMLDRSEFGTITTYINILAESLRGFIQKNSNLNKQLNSLTFELADNSESLSNNTREQATSIEEIMAATEEINSGAESVVNNIEDQMTSMYSLRESMDKLSDIMTTVQNSINFVIKQSNDIKYAVKIGVSTLNAMIESLKVVSESSEKMSGITQIIDDISDNINLLSLNASIEAARAGNAGKGFAVVAEEISKLAELTANSIKDINILVKDNTDEIHNSIKKIDDTVMTMNNITGLVDLIDKRTAEIFMQVTTQNQLNVTVNNEAGSILKKSEIVKISMIEQQNALSEITRTVAYISDSTDITAQAAENLHAKAREVDTIASGLLDESAPDVHL